MTLTWSDTYETGNDRIDGQHLKLFELTNRLEAMLAGREKLDPTPVLSYLETFVNIHFCYEELCMAMGKCSVQQTNKDAHAKFMALFAQFKSRFASEGATRGLVQDLHDAIAGWIVKHICKIDVELRQCART
ncbi:MAG: hemerythrin family protein [Planctomycetes bacterium]|nr:hemerythrin family protein [Planctomycetota bacterium]